MLKPISEWLGEEIIREAIPLRDVPGLLPRLRRGKRVHISTIYRWVKTGVRGVRLASFRVGATQCTNPRLLSEFLSCLSGPRDESNAQLAESSVKQSPYFQSKCRDVENELDQLGI